MAVENTTLETDDVADEVVLGEAVRETFHENVG